MVQHKGGTFPILTGLNYSYQSYHFETIHFLLTNHSSMKLSPFLQTERNEATITGTLTRVDYLRINK